ncbi:phage holin family protein [Roseomonas eburnea]|uniref:Phage holin family protein n=1 Tax=Neoroseomonas eburnea TaxID=1346889 RepID=A0A9X9XDN3_9PROT|nr:phage holin family protein [Neoroseomonas eburnea]MBR0681819.1 phage holin family protein [Neoroseomonas eburnea]
MLGFIVRTVIMAVALWVAVSIVPGLEARDWRTLLLAAIVLGIVNATIRPVALLFSIPITILTFGLFVLVVNAGMLALVAWLVPAFTISGFWAAALGAIVVSLVSAAINGGLTTG